MTLPVRPYIISFTLDDEKKQFVLVAYNYREAVEITGDKLQNDYFETDGPPVDVNIEKVDIRPPSSAEDFRLVSDFMREKELPWSEKAEGDVDETLRDALAKVMAENRALYQNLAATQARSTVLLDAARDLRRKLIKLGGEDPGPP